METFFSAKQKQPCESILKSFLLSLPSLLASWRNRATNRLLNPTQSQFLLRLSHSLTAVGAKSIKTVTEVDLSFFQMAAHVLVRKATHVIQAAGQQLKAINLAFTNNNAYAGILLISLAPVFEYSYRLFDEHAGVKTDYWNAYYFLHAIGPNIYVICLVTGFILVPKKVLKHAVVIPLTYKFSGIVWLATVSNNEDFHKAAPWSFIVMGLSIALIWVMCFKWLMTLHFHKKQGTIARILGIIDAPGIDDQTIIAIARSEKEKLKIIDSQ